MNRICVFESAYGYNGILRIGKLYNIPSDHYYFLMTNYEDLIDMSHFFTVIKWKWKEKMKIKILSMFHNYEYLRNRELGIRRSHADLLNDYYNIYFRLKRMGSAGNRTPNHLHPKQVSYH